MRKAGEHTSQGLSQRLKDKGFKGEHEYSWMGSCIDDKPFCGSNENSVAHRRICPAYTFPELWEPLTLKQRKKLLQCILDTSYIMHDNLAEVAGEWLIDNGHIEVSP